MEISNKIVMLLIFFIAGINNSYAVVNGQEGSLYESIIVRIVVSAQAAQKSEMTLQELKKSEICTGTFVSSNQILTAGHCVFNSLEKKQFLYLAVEQKEKNKFILKKLNLLKSQWQPEEVEQKIEPGSICVKPGMPLFRTKTKDIAILESPNFRSRHWLTISNKRPYVGQKILFAGYGIKRNPFEGVQGLGLMNDLKLTFGENVVREVNSQRFSFKADIMKAFAADGDSGSPIIADDKIIGVMSTVSEHCESEFGEDYGILNTATLVGE